MPNPLDYSKPMLPDAHYGNVGSKAKSKRVDKDIDDDAPTEQWVIDELGFDPKE